MNKGSVDFVTEYPFKLTFRFRALIFQSSANVTVGSMKGQLKGLETEDVDSYSDFESEEEGEHHPPIQPGGDNKPTK